MEVGIYVIQSHNYILIGNDWVAKSEFVRPGMFATYDNAERHLRKVIRWRNPIGFNATLFESAEIRNYSFTIE